MVFPFIFHLIEIYLNSSNLCSWYNYLFIYTLIFSFIINHLLSKSFPQILLFKYISNYAQLIPFVFYAPPHSPQFQNSQSKSCNPTPLIHITAGYIAHDTAICCYPQNSSNWGPRISRHLGYNVVSTNNCLSLHFRVFFPPFLIHLPVRNAGPLFPCAHCSYLTLTVHVIIVTNTTAFNT